VNDLFYEICVYVSGAAQLGLAKGFTNVNDDGSKLWFKEKTIMGLVQSAEFPERGSSGENILEKPDLTLGLKKEAVASKQNCRTRTRDSHIYAGAHIYFHSTDSLDSNILFDNKIRQ
jgi:hypothetical protein